MIRFYVVTAIILSLTACSGSVEVDPASVIPGSWGCDDEIILTINPNGKYEWRVLPYDEVTLYTEGNEFLRMNEDGGHSILGKWRLDGDILELDMLGEADRFTLTFQSQTSFRMNGPESYSCIRQ